MTFEKWAQNFLAERGMFNERAKEVIEATKDAKENEAMMSRWKDDISDYPNAMLKVMSMTLREHAMEWIVANMPQAWFRSMFE